MVPPRANLEFDRIPRPLLQWTNPPEVDMTSELSPALVNLVLELRRSLEAEFRADMARDMAGRGIKPTEIARVMGVSRNTVYRYLERAGKEE